MKILLDGHTIATSYKVTCHCLGVVIDAELTFATHVKRVASRCFYTSFVSCGLFGPRCPLTKCQNAGSPLHCKSYKQHLIAHRCRSLLVPNAAVRLIVKKRKWDSITPTIRDTLRWLLMRQRIDFKDFVYWSTSVFTSSPPHTSCRVDDQSVFGSLYTSPLALKVTWLCHGQEQLASDHEAFQSLGQRSFSVKQSAA